MPAAKVLPSVPDMKTMTKDLNKASVQLADESGRRLDYHALRHTFQTNLDRTGCSRATKKKLMRHAHEDVTDGYAHAELAEMLTALRRIPAPDVSHVKQSQHVATGTDALGVVQGQDQTAFTPRQWLAMVSGDLSSIQPNVNIATPATSVIDGTGWQAMALAALIGPGTGDTVEITRPSTQVD